MNAADNALQRLHVVTAWGNFRAVKSGKFGRPTGRVFLHGERTSAAAAGDFVHVFLERSSNGAVPISEAIRKVLTTLYHGAEYPA